MFRVEFPYPTSMQLKDSLNDNCMCCRILVYSLRIAECETRDPVDTRWPVFTMRLPGNVMTMMRAGRRMFAGLDNGHLLVFHRDTGTELYAMSIYSVISI
jgi:hypothetical protein